MRLRNKLVVFCLVCLSCLRLRRAEIYFYRILRSSVP